MEYFEVFSEFFHTNKIDSNLISIFSELFEISCDIAFLLDDNYNIRESYSKNDLNELKTIRESFIKKEIDNLNKSLTNLMVLKSTSEGDVLKLINSLILSKEKSLKKQNETLSFPNFTKESLIFKHENNRKLLLLNLNKLREIESKLKRENKASFLHDLKILIEKLVNLYRFGSDISIGEIKKKINMEYSYLDIEYLRNINEKTVEEIVSEKENIDTKEKALKYLNKLYSLNANHQKPIINNAELIKIRDLEERIYSLNLYEYLAKSENNVELRTYNVLLKGQLESLYIEVDNEEKRKQYLNSLSNTLNTITSLNEKLEPLKVSNGIFDYNIENFDSVKTIKIDGKKKWIRYKRGNKNNYSLIENREIIMRELDYWKKEMDSGFDRWDRGNFYKDVEETFNFIKLFYKYRSYIMYLEVSNKLFKFNDSSKKIIKDKKTLNELRDYLMEKVSNFRIKGITYWKSDITPEDYFSKYAEYDRKVIIESILPKDGIGRCIESYEIFKIIYGDSYVKENINEFETKSNNK